jgi:hypothetical protein
MVYLSMHIHYFFPSLISRHFILHNVSNMRPRRAMQRSLGINKLMYIKSLERKANQCNKLKYRLFFNRVLRGSFDK